ncbi:MAG: tripartite tricarboxylate transporter substrate-binding protein [Meiothermus sp.]|uniref:Bug family tripartite tricarboxylate transporter substrate binding protein n=1 Tax=Meiothermus sp. TaxID=1955249 RepID=UPI0025E3AAC8|nr:tripartite tricarboxylate transporter substrate-binding protein [Meiothermus sp.]MCS7057317.1 tripartite tricarboxylate transporter substrate-binding protein [Meiothermus sp.]MCS7194764.1 tripartite tricarboxylate transporter substrate-binding protein [Meiothermus sp.]MDW8091249.1 tripartite tricarboxylate transporter substrate-binding protein [Meiothermus sp.]MDW8480368.1 tripartite tricarboxylate transporter substrate-binding protein [Meiothermus sp.]
MRWVVATTLVALVGSGLAQFTPRSPECIAPAGAGGGWDFTCRSVAQVMLDLKIIPQPMRVTNMTGGGGGVAYANVVTQRNNDPNLIVAASPATTVRLAQGQYSRFTERDVRWLGAIAADFGLVAVKADAPWRSMQELVAAWKADPAKIAVGGGSAVGGQDHMKVLLLGRAAGIEPRNIKYVPFDGGGEALTSLLGGFIQVFAGDASELRAQVQAGTVRVLGVMAPRRLEGVYANIPTLRELGYNVDWVVWRGFYAPKNMPIEAYEFWVQALRQVERSPEWARVREQNALGKFSMVGAEFQVFVDRQVNQFRNLSRELGIIR